MKRARVHTQGFTLIASLLMLLLLSGIAIGLLMMANTEGKVGGSDLQNNLAFHAADGGIEKMASDLSATFQNAQSPTAAQICALGGTSYQPSMVGVTWTQYTVTPASGCAGTLTATWGQITQRTEPGIMGADHTHQHADHGGAQRRAGSEYDAGRAGGVDSGVPVWSVLGKRSLVLQRSEF